MEQLDFLEPRNNFRVPRSNTPIELSPVRIFLGRFEIQLKSIKKTSNFGVNLDKIVFLVQTFVFKVRMFCKVVSFAPALAQQDQKKVFDHLDSRHLAKVYFSK